MIRMLEGTGNLKMLTKNRKEECGMVFNDLLNLLVAGFILNFAALVLFILFSVMEWLRCHFHNIPFESAFDDFCRFYANGFLPTMAILFVTTLVLKLKGG